MIKLYHPKKRTVREIDKDDALRLRLLKRAGYLVGDLPAPKKPKPQKVEEVLPPTEGEEEAADAKSEPVMAEHAPVESLLEDPHPFAEMSMLELRTVAADEEITVPFDVRSKLDIAAFLEKELGEKDDGEEQE